MATNNLLWQTNPLLKTKTPSLSSTQPAATAPSPVKANPILTKVTQPTAPAIPAAAPTPAPATQTNTNASTPAQVYGADLATYTPDEYDTAVSELISTNKKLSSETVSPEKTYRDKLRLYQKEIDAINRLYAQKISEERVAGQNRLGQGRAIQARSGILGSDFASAQNDTIGTYNTELMGGIQAEQSAKVNALLGQARKDAIDEVAAKNAAKKEGAESYLKYLGEQATRRATKLDNFLASIGDTDLTKVSPTNLAEVAKSYGITVDELKTRAKEVKDTADQAAAKLELETRKSEAEIDKINADIASGKLITLGEGSTLYNTETGETFKNPKTYAPSEGTGGDKMLTVTEAQTLGVPFGTMLSEVVGQGIVPTGKTTGEQQTNFGFYQRAQDATETISPLEETIASQPLKKQFQMQFAPNVLQDQTQQSYRQAQRQFTEARLRADSGAAVPDAEYEADARTYFAQPGDTAKTLAQKRAARQEVLNAMAIQSGGAYRDYFGTTPVAAVKNSSLRDRVEAAGYDYEAMKADGLSDAEIEQSI
jgi:hypothetical protein